MQHVTSSRDTMTEIHRAAMSAEIGLSVSDAEMRPVLLSVLLDAAAVVPARCGLAVDE